MCLVQFFNKYLLAIVRIRAPIIVCDTVIEISDELRQIGERIGYKLTDNKGFGDVAVMNTEGDDPKK